MKAKVYVTLKPSVLDPQGKAIHHSVELMGFGSVANMRRGKFFESRSTKICPNRKRKRRSKRLPKTFWQIRSSKIIRWK